MQALPWRKALQSFPFPDPALNLSVVVQVNDDHIWRSVKCVCECVSVRGEMGKGIIYQYTSFSVIRKLIKLSAAN